MLKTLHKAYMNIILYNLDNNPINKALLLRERTR